MQEEWDAEDEIGVVVRGQAGNEAGMRNTKNQSGNCKKEADEGAGSADVEEGAVGANGRTDDDERTEGANGRREGNEERVAGANMMVTAGEEVAEFVSEKNDEESKSKRETRREGGGMAVKEREIADELVDGGFPIVSEGEGELRAGNEAGAESEKKKQNGEEQRFERGMSADGRKERSVGGKRAPVKMCAESLGRIF
jgi:hypothetical protein